MNGLGEATPMQAPRERSRPRLAHLMVLIGVVALAIIATQACLDEMRRFQHGFNHLVNWFVIACPSVLLLMLAIFAITLSDRPKKLFRRPGFVACWITMLAIAFKTPEFVMQSGYTGMPGMPLSKFVNYGFYWTLSVYVGGWIMVAWLTLALAGAWRPDRTWSDRVARALGVFWILADVANRFAWKLWLW